MFYGRWDEMLGDSIKGTVAILDKLVKSPDYKVVALTNWSHETFPKALKKFDFLQWFEGIIVSGEEKTRKPFIDIYQITLNRFDLEPQKSIFIDDNHRNVEAANALGINGIQFKSPSKLIEQLKPFNIHI